MNLALAVLQDVFDGDESLARKCANDFKRTVIAQLPEDGFSLSEEDVRQAALGLTGAMGRKRV